ncbi:DUF3794 domain-containing protein [Sporomusa acidovorans]|uniref:SipL SPOCS domain-containing protein n=1 Tax=Sporomusa acidovorans (strain ATCC 49682 / DSM 3132 / Mol) TaxID=1123286 RepID=A0ABZ3JAE2_SPOA4|nr:DUF3794 domain-containing protein [Sporomusa acidovorans]OZC15123.1 hypothetical protein SPACI_50350 [Sporomusa acidovorans DSM 3132]SDF86260.1 protein of unknown function [Sporomusa acidovorans]
MSHKKHKRIPQFTVNSTLSIPDDKADIEFLLRVTSTPVIEQCIVSTKQIHITGYINIFTEYVASVRAETQPVNFVFFKLPFDQTFAYSRARTGMNGCLKCDIIAQYPQLTNPREIVLALDVKISGVKLARAYHSLPPHHCRPYIANFFDEASNPHINVPSYCPDSCSDQPHSTQFSQIS